MQNIVTDSYEYGNVINAQYMEKFETIIVAHCHITGQSCAVGTDSYVWRIISDLLICLAKVWPSSLVKGDRKEERRRIERKTTKKNPFTEKAPVGWCLSSEK